MEEEVGSRGSECHGEGQRACHLQAGVGKRVGRWRWRSSEKSAKVERKMPGHWVAGRRWRLTAVSPIR